jgi:hypothetical protein
MSNEQRGYINYKFDFNTLNVTEIDRGVTIVH